MKGFRTPWFLAVLVIALMMSACAGSGGMMQSGTTQEAVEKALGLPNGVHRRWMPNKEIREVWVYHKRGSIMERHLYPDTRVIVFSNGKVVATNPKDPYAAFK